MRDDFSEKVKRDLAGRAGYKCSNPNCRISTIEAKYTAEGTVSIGEAAHICAASEGGMRYNANMSSKERSSADNGVWLCRNCAAMIDRDSIYTVAMLYKWKYNAEAQASSINSFGVSKFDRDVLGSVVNYKVAQAAIQQICIAEKKDLVFLAYRVAIPRQRFNIRKAFSTKWRVL